MVQVRFITTCQWWIGYITVAFIIVLIIAPVCSAYSWTRIISKNFLQLPLLGWWIWMLSQHGVAHSIDKFSSLFSEHFSAIFCYLALYICVSVSCLLYYCTRRECIPNPLHTLKLHQPQWRSVKWGLFGVGKKHNIYQCRISLLACIYRIHLNVSSNSKCSK